MTALFTTICSLLLLAARFLLYMGIALFAMAALRIAMADGLIMLHHLTAR